MMSGGRLNGNIEKRKALCRTLAEKGAEGAQCVAHLRSLFGELSWTHRHQRHFCVLHTITDPPLSVSFLYHLML